jgi:hypothetical protein
MPPFTQEQIRQFLVEYGYTTDSEGFVKFYSIDFEPVLDTESYLDVYAGAVRRGHDEVPDRPVRMTFHKLLRGASFRWELKSVEELAPGVKSKAYDRSLPKVSPWPKKKP